MTGTVGGAQRLLTRSFVLLSAAELAYFLSVGMTFGVLPLYVTGPVGSNEAGAGLAVGAFGLTALLCRPIAGHLTDTLGKRPLLVAGAVIAGLGMLALPLTASLPVVVAIRLSQGIAEGLFAVAGFALLVDIAPPARVGEALSYNSLSLYLGIALGPLLGEALLVASGFTAAWLSAALLLALSAVLASALSTGPPTSTGDAGGTGAGWFHRPAIAPALGFLASLIAVGGFLAFAVLHAEALGMANTSVPLLVYGLTVVGCRIAFARVPDRLPSLPLGAASLVAICAGLCLMALWATPAGLLTGAVVAAIGVTFSTPAFFSAIFATAPPSRRGAAAATATACIDLGFGLGPVMLGLVASAYDIPAAMLAGAAVALAGVAWSLTVARRGRQ